MNKHLIILALIVTASFTSCKKKLTSCIELESTTFSTGEEVTFTSCSENVISLDWRIAGPIGAVENVKGWSDRVFVNTFSTPGSYTITLKTYDDFSYQGNSESTSQTFSVN